MAQTFRLASLLRLRQAQENEAAGDLARANSARQDARTARQQARGALAGHALPTGSTTGFMAAVAARSALSNAYLGSLETEEHAQRTVDTAEEAWREAHRRTKALERLEERHRADSLAAELKSEQSRLDELAGRHPGGAS